ncbi:hypothetical protein GCM10010428_52710 [Actinosynnema pretiosum subsp. pretiosum]
MTRGRGSECLPESESTVDGVRAGVVARVGAARLPAVPAAYPVLLGAVRDRAKAKAKAGAGAGAVALAVVGPVSGQGIAGQPVLSFPGSVCPDRPVVPGSGVWVWVL